MFVQEKILRSYVKTKYISARSHFTINLSTRCLHWRRRTWRMQFPDRPKNYAATRLAAGLICKWYFTNFPLLMLHLLHGSFQRSVLIQLCRFPFLMHGWNLTSNFARDQLFYLNFRSMTGGESQLAAIGRAKPSLKSESDADTVYLTKWKLH